MASCGSNPTHSGTVGTEAVQEPALLQIVHKKHAVPPATHR